MSHFETESTVNAKQQIVLDGLLSGMTRTAAAEAAGVHRSTVQRWLSDDDSFVAELNRSRQERRDLQAGKLDAIADSALDVVSNALQKGNDVRLALDLLKSLDLLEIQSIGATTPEGVAHGREYAKQQQELISSLLI